MSGSRYIQLGALWLTNGSRVLFFPFFPDEQATPFLDCRNVQTHGGTLYSFHAQIVPQVRYHLVECVEWTQVSCGGS